MNVYGIMDIELSKPCHETTYLEWEIPKKLEKKLNRIIKKKIKGFIKKCKCDFCKESVYQKPKK